MTLFPASPFLTLPAGSGGTPTPAPSPTLNALSGTFTLTEDASAGAVAGALAGKTSGSTLSLVDDAGGRVALSGSNVVRGATALDYESATSHSFTVREALAGATNTPRDTVLSLTVTDVSEVVPLTKLVAEGDSITFSPTSYAERWADDNPGIAFVNEGVTGSGIGELEDRLAATMANDPSHLTVLIGANDLNSTGAFPATQDYIDAVLAYVAAAKVINPALVVGVGGILPVGPAWWAYEGFNARRATFNAAMRAVVGNQIDFYIPFGDHPEMNDAAAADPAMFDELNVHPLGPAQAINAGTYAAVMNPIRDGATGTAPAAFAFADVEGAALSTEYTATMTVTGLGMGETATASISGAGTMRLGHGTYGTGDLNVMNGDVVTVKLMSSDTAETEATATLTVGGVSDTFNVSTVAPSIALPGDLMFWWSAQDAATMAQANDGSGVVAADGDPVGSLQDKSGSGIHLTSTNNSTHRPVWHDAGGIKYLSSDGVDQFLHRLSTSLPIGLDGEFTLAVALRSNAAANSILFGLRGVDNSSPSRCPLATRSGSGLDGAVFYRADDGSTYATGGSIGTNRYTGLWDGQWRVVMLVVSGGMATFYKDGAAGTPWAVSEGALDFDDTYSLALFASFGNPGTGEPLAPFAADMNEMAGWSVALDAGQIAAETTRLAALQGGRTL